MKGFRSTKENYSIFNLDIMVWFAAKSIDKRPSKSSGKNYSVPSLSKKRGLRSESVYLFSSFLFQRHSGVLSCRWSMSALLFHTSPLPPHQKSSSTLPNQAVWKYTFCTKTNTHSRSRSTSIEGAKFSESNEKLEQYFIKVSNSLQR